MSFIDLFSSKSLTEVLVFFLLNPGKEAYQSEVVEATGQSLIQVQRALKKLESSGIVFKRTDGNRVYYESNRHHPAFEDIKNALLKTIVIGDNLRKRLCKIKDKVQFVFVYGSVAKAKEGPKSDLDLFIIGDLGIRELANIIGPLSEEIHREINPTVYSLSEFKQKMKEKNVFINEILHDAKIWIIGEQNEFEKMVG